ncbi:hypothetical protein VNO77_17463 [Canavalia gladiata]|uniref:Uncharacterized protein n=1 Tax=Canavalia gladiata TaxID=3824 RepID=A0AAN9LIX9_CANGL
MAYRGNSILHPVASLVTWRWENQSLNDKVWLSSCQRCPKLEQKLQDSHGTIKTSFNKGSGLKHTNAPQHLIIQHNLY